MDALNNGSDVAGILAQAGVIIVRAGASRFSVRHAGLRTGCIECEDCLFISTVTSGCRSQER